MEANTVSMSKFSNGVSKEQIIGNVNKKTKSSYLRFQERLLP
jgi:hypothetical protein